MRKKIFISYRREDEPAEARSIHDRLVQSFGQQNIFMDVDSLVAGVDFQKSLDSALNERVLRTRRKITESHFIGPASA